VHGRDPLGAAPEGLAQIHARRAAIKDALRGRAADIDGLIVWLGEARARVDELSSPGSDPATVERELAAAQDRARARGGPAGV